MNRDNVLRLADSVEASETYDQLIWYHSPCGTPGCIAGHAYELALADGHVDVPLQDFRLRQGFSGSIERCAKSWMDISWSDANDLFDGEPLGMCKVSSRHAAKVLRHFAKTGEVEWRRELSA